MRPEHLKDLVKTLFGENDRRYQRSEELNDSAIRFKWALERAEHSTGATS